jgi:hypothetical protein
MIAEGSGSLFGAGVPRIEHEHDDEHDHDALNFGIQVKQTRSVCLRAFPLFQPVARWLLRRPRRSADAELWRPC